MRVLVTGANGHLGANTVRSLLQFGYEVVPFVRTTSNLRGIEKLGLPCRYGDVLDEVSLCEAAAGCDAIIHHATVYRLWARDTSEILQPALEGTKNIFKAARDNGVRRMVYTSSIAACGYSRDPSGLRNESDWNGAAKSPYNRAKTRSEQEAVRLSEAYGVPTIRLCPALVLGPYDYGMTPSTKIIRDFINRTGTTYEAGMNFVHVSDVAKAHALALEKGEPGERYIVGGDNVHLKDISSRITALTGVKPGHLGFKGPVAEAIGMLAGGAARLTGKEPPFTREIVQDLVGWYAYFDCGKAEKTFGFKPRGIEAVLTDTIRWLLFLGKLDARVAERTGPRFPPDPGW